MDADKSYILLCCFAGTHDKNCESVLLHSIVGYVCYRCCYWWTGRCVFFADWSGDTSSSEHGVRVDPYCGSCRFVSHVLERVYEDRFWCSGSEGHRRAFGRSQQCPRLGCVSLIIGEWVCVGVSVFVCVRVCLHVFSWNDSRFYRVSNTPGNLGNLLKIFWLTWNSCASQCTSKTSCSKPGLIDIGAINPR